MFSKEELQKIVNMSHSLKDVIRKIGYATDSGSNSKTVKKRLDKYNIDYSHFETLNGIQRTAENIFIENSTACQAVLRRWYIRGNYTEYKCSICNKPPMWQGRPLTLILDHINGNNKDDRLQNLRWVCQNCNSQLETTNGKNYKNRKPRTQNTKRQPSINFRCIECGRPIIQKSNSGMCIKCVNLFKRACERPDRDKLKELIRNKPFTEIGKMFGVTDNAVRKWCAIENLPKSKTLINFYSDKEWDLL